MIGVKMEMPHLLVAEVPVPAFWGKAEAREKKATRAVAGEKCILIK